jgi:DNA-binding NtrC family response regulator
LNVITLTIPPLRDRKEDILILANHFLETKSPIRSPKRLTSHAEDALLNYDYPGNIRELEHIIERALIFAEGDLIHTDDLNLPRSSSIVEILSVTNEETIDENNILCMDDLERLHITKALKRFRWDRKQTADQLGISQKTLYTKIKKYEIKQE